MLNDFHMMVFAVLTSQVGIAALLAVMAMLEPGKSGSGGPSWRHTAGDVSQVRGPRDAPGLGSGEHAAAAPARPPA